MNDCNSIQQKLSNIKRTYYGFYYDIGIVLDQFSTEELFKYYLQNNESSLRYYLEEQIINEEIMKAKNK